jgi:hypothetical protein
MSAPAQRVRLPSGGQILNTARATTGRIGSGCESTGTSVARSMDMGCAGAGPEAAARTVADGTTVLEPESPAQHIPPIESPSDAQQSSAAIWAQVRQGHSAKTKLDTITARRPRWSRRSAEVTAHLYHSRAGYRKDPIAGVQEGFVNQFAMMPTNVGGPLVFESEALENVPKGWKARETYQVISNDEFVETFEIASTGPYEIYSRSRFKRKRAR